MTTNDKKRAYQRAWYTKNREQLLPKARASKLRNKKPLTPEQKARKNASQRAYYASNREQELIKQRERRLLNSSKISESRKRKYWKDPEKAKASSRANYSANKEARAAWAKVYRANNKELIRLRKIRGTYGLTPDDYNTLKSKQDNRCAVCLSELVEENRQTHVDHCHTTGDVRGLLCVDCNVGLGRLKDNYVIAYNAFVYLLGFALGAK